MCYKGTLPKAEMRYKGSKMKLITLARYPTGPRPGVHQSGVGSFDPGCNIKLEFELTYTCRVIDVPQFK